MIQNKFLLVVSMIILCGVSCDVAGSAVYDMLAPHVEPAAKGYIDSAVADILAKDAFSQRPSIHIVAEQSESEKRKLVTPGLFDRLAYKAGFVTRGYMRASSDPLYEEYMQKIVAILSRLSSFQGADTSDRLIPSGGNDRSVRSGESVYTSCMRGGQCNVRAVMNKAKQVISEMNSLDRIVKDVYQKVKEYRLDSPLFVYVVLREYARLKMTTAQDIIYNLYINSTVSKTIINQVYGFVILPSLKEMLLQVMPEEQVDFMLAAAPVALYRYLEQKQEYEIALFAWYNMTQKERRNIAHFMSASQ